jgi:hypothetical protein
MSLEMKDAVRFVKKSVAELADNTYGLHAGDGDISPSTRKLTEAVALGVLVAQDVQSRGR